MDITQTTTAPTRTTSPTPNSSDAVITSDFETFLKMLTVQMENQDPLNPTDSAEYAQQLATFSGVEQQVLTNELLNALMVQMNTTGMAQMADWVGKEARIAAPAQFSGQPISIASNPAAAADQVELVVSDAQGNEVQRATIPRASSSIEWAGTSPSGQPFTEGLYSFRVVSSLRGEIILDEQAEVYSRVTEVRNDNGVSVLVLDGGIPVEASQVSGIREH